MYNRLDTIPACDRRTDERTDRQTSCYGIVRAMHTRRAVKNEYLSRDNQKLVYHLSCQVQLSRAYCVFALAVCLKTWPRDVVWSWP